ncbi:MAG: class D sortase [Candidatus Pelethousia sp.]|nr:class D sortase [Candidatus Pelethousia sp.]
MVVAEGTNDSVLRYAVGHFKDTAMPGEAGNFALSGHRSYAFGQFFNRLGELEAGDSLIVERDDKIYTYKVSEILVVEPEDVWVLDKTEDAQITLVTCTPIRVATHRLIIKGVMEG